MWWILIQYQWYLNNGDLNYLKKNRDYLFATLDLLEKKIEPDGQENLDGMRFLDWPTSPNKQAIHAGLQSLMVMTFEAGEKIAIALDDKERPNSIKQFSF